MTRHKVYIESTIPSYYIEKPNRDLIVTARQQITREWWNSESQNFNLYVSEIVMAEISIGNNNLVAARLTVVAGIPVLPVTDNALHLADTYMNRTAFLPSDARQDALHIALAVVYKMDYLLTWNCKHIANGEVIRWIEIINRELGHWHLVIVTPDELTT